LRAIIRRRANVVFGNEYGELFNDEVVSPAGTPGHYLRWRWSAAGVVAIPVDGERVALVPAYRYPAGDVFLELPRGAAEDGEPVEDAAMREMAEEAGLTGGTPRTLGVIYPDTGLIETGVTVVRIDVDPREAGNAAGRPAAPEAMESIGAPRWFGEGAARDAIVAGEIRCGVTLAALTLLWASRGRPA
jgi:ADP-ribose pyrophosphatase